LNAVYLYAGDFRAQILNKDKPYIREITDAWKKYFHGKKRR